MIITPRHTKVDLDLYREYEEMDRILKVPLKKIDRSLQVIKSWIAQHDDAVAFTSWGKDSVVLLHLLALLDAKIPVVYMLLTLSANPDCKLVRDAFLRKYPLNYHEFLYDETKIGKHEEHWKMIADLYGYHRITGIRNDESGIRRMVFLMYREASIYSCRPLSIWNNADIFAYIEQNNLPLNPVYGYLGGGRWDRKHIRTHSLVGTVGDSFGRTEWEREYYPDMRNRILSGEHIGLNG